MASSSRAFGNESRVSLESVISTAELSRRATRPADHVAENKALTALAREMVTAPNNILRKLAETALTLCRAGSSGISLLEPDGEHFHWPAITGAWADHVGGGTPREFGPCGTVLDRNAPQLMSHPERYFDYLASVTPEIEEVLLIPFYIEGKAVGTIWVIAHDSTHRFDAEDLRVMTNLATFAAAAYQMLQSTARIESTQSELRHSLGAHQELQDRTEETIKRRTERLALTNELLVNEVRERTHAEAALAELSAQFLQAQDEERRRIARDLHDTTGQALAALSMNLAQMQNSFSPANALRLAECLELASSASSEIRNLSYLLHPPMMDELGLGSALADYAAGFEGRSGLKIAVEVSSDVGRLQGNREIALFRIVQEGLGNIHRHSGSPTANIRIFRDNQSVVLEVTDQGRGLTRREDGKLMYGVGLRSMQERLRPFNGSLSIESSDAGTKVTVMLPQAPAVIPE
jgi:signal transduction histidine kinase